MRQSASTNMKNERSLDIYEYSYRHLKPTIYWYGTKILYISVIHFCGYLFEVIIYIFFWNKYEPQSDVDHTTQQNTKYIK